MSRRWIGLVFALLLAAGAACVPRVHANNPPLVAIQAGHWRTNEQPDEFKWLRTSTGASAGGVHEVDLNVDIAHRVVKYLRDWGNDAFVVPATVPPNYRADAFVALHSDGNTNTSARGYKVATYWRNWEASDMLVRELADQYGKDTGLPKDWRITGNMRGYYAFNSGLYEHTIAEDTPAAILEMGFLSNAADRAFMIRNRDLIARSIALGVARFLGTRPATGWSPPPLLPRGDIVEVLHNNVPLFADADNQTKRIDSVYSRERYAVAERRPGWARLFSYSGTVRWVQDWQTRPIQVP